jgi:hypothetical protein
MILSAACSKGGGGVDVDDDGDRPPAAVTDLAVVDSTVTSLTLSWTAPVSDDEHGLADWYDLRHAPVPPTPSSWESATPVAGEPTPLPGGMRETFTVGGLAPGATYYFAIRCGRGAGVASPISNVAGARVPVDLEVTFADARLEAVIRAAIAKPSGSLHQSDLVPIETLNASEREIVDLSGLENCAALRDLNVEANRIVSLAPVAGLRRLEGLLAGNNRITDPAPIAGLTALRHLALWGNQITDIGALAGLPEIITANLERNGITDLAPLVANAGIGAGDVLYLRDNPLSAQSIEAHIPTLQARGATVVYGSSQKGEARGAK